MAEATLNKNMIEGQIKPINGMSENYSPFSIPLIEMTSCLSHERNVIC